MTKFWLAGVAVFAMMTGTALAQDTSSDTRTTTHSDRGGVHSSKSRNTVDRNGVETDKSKTYSRDDRGLHVRSDTRTVTPEGSVHRTSHEERTESPGGDTMTRSRTTTRTEQ